MFKIKDHQKNTVTFNISDTNGELYGEFTLATLSYHMWNKLGFLVTADEAPAKKNPKNPKEYIPDVIKQQELDTIAEAERNAIRIAWALENAPGGIDWDGKDPQTWEEKGQIMQTMDASLFHALINALAYWAYGKKVSPKEVAERFPDLQKDGSEGDSQKGNDL